MLRKMTIPGDRLIEEVESKDTEDTDTDSVKSYPAVETMPDSGIFSL